MYDVSGVDVNAIMGVDVDIVDVSDIAVRFETKRKPEKLKRTVSNVIPTSQYCVPIRKVYFTLSDVKYASNCPTN